MNRTISVEINGRVVDGEVEPRLLLGDFIRDNAALTGTHFGCEHGVCGACTVQLDGQPVRSPHRDRRRHGAQRVQPASAPTGISRIACAAVRLLYAGHLDDDGGVSTGRSRPDAGTDPKRACRQPLPVYRLPEHHHGGAPCGGPAEGRNLVLRC